MVLLASVGAAVGVVLTITCAHIFCLWAPSCLVSRDGKSNELIDYICWQVSCSSGSAHVVSTAR